MSKSFEINGRRIGLTESPYIIAEMSANHNGKIENAYKIIEMAKRAGADAVKLQSYTPDTITINMNTSDFMIKEVFGMVKAYMIYIKVPLCLGNGTNLFLIMLKRMKLLF